MKRKMFLGFIAMILVVSIVGCSSEPRKAKNPSKVKKSKIITSITLTEKEEPKIIKKASLSDKKTEVRRTIDEISAKIDKEIGG